MSGPDRRARAHKTRKWASHMHNAYCRKSDQQRTDAEYTSLVTDAMMAGPEGSPSLGTILGHSHNKSLSTIHLH